MGYLDFLARDAVDSPVASWQHTETSGTTAADSSGNSLNATLGAGITVNQASAIPGYDGPVVSCSGASGSTITVANNSLLNASNTTGLTIGRFLKMDAAGAGDVLYTIWDKTGLTQNNKQWCVFWDNRSSQGSPLALRVQWGYNGGGATVLSWTGTAARDALIAGGWLVNRFTPNSLGDLFWFDGTTLTRIQVSPMTGYSAGPGNVANARSLTMGYFSGPNYWFKGQLGPAQVWNKILPEQHIRARVDALLGNSIRSWVRL